MDRLPGVPERAPYPSTRDAYERLGVPCGLAVAMLFVVGGAFSSAGITPPWVPWLATFLLVGALTIAGWRAFLRWGRLVERAQIVRSSVGDWTLSRDDVTVDGALVLFDPADARLFHYRIQVVLSENTGGATVHTLGSPSTASSGTE